MEFKIDTKDTFSVITPVATEIDANMTDELAGKCEELAQNGSRNFIVDLQHCIKLDKSAVNGFVKMHEENYAKERSLVFTNLQPAVTKALKEDESDLLLNIAPKMQEAIDIIAMEILERDLFNEES